MVGRWAGRQCENAGARAVAACGEWEGVHVSRCGPDGAGEEKSSEFA